ncbi:hypothetical protein IAT38_006220 [Cryptococcus sp. DSM 104549]
MFHPQSPSWPFSSLWTHPTGSQTAPIDTFNPFYPLSLSPPSNRSVSIIPPWDYDLGTLPRGTLPLARPFARTHSDYTQLCYQSAAQEDIMGVLRRMKEWNDAEEWAEPGPATPIASDSGYLSSHSDTQYIQRDSHSPTRPLTARSLAGNHARTSPALTASLDLPSLLPMGIDDSDDVYGGFEPFDGPDSRTTSPACTSLITPLALSPMSVLVASTQYARGARSASAYASSSPSKTAPFPQSALEFDSREHGGEVRGGPLSRTGSFSSASTASSSLSSTALSDDEASLPLRGSAGFNLEVIHPSAALRTMYTSEERTGREASLGSAFEYDGGWDVRRTERMDKGRQGDGVSGEGGDESEGSDGSESGFGDEEDEVEVGDQAVRGPLVTGIKTLPAQLSPTRTHSSYTLTPSSSSSAMTLQDAILSAQEVKNQARRNLRQMSGESVRKAAGMRQWGAEWNETREDDEAPEGSASYDEYGNAGCDPIFRAPFQTPSRAHPATQGQSQGSPARSTSLAHNLTYSTPPRSHAPQATAAASGSLYAGVKGKGQKRKRSLTPDDGSSSDESDTDVSEDEKMDDGEDEYDQAIRGATPEMVYINGKRRFKKLRTAPAGGDVVRYTEAEDDIILATWDGRPPLTLQTIEKCRDELVKAGFTERTCAALKYRAHNSLKPKFDLKRALLTP